MNCEFAKVCSLYLKDRTLIAQKLSSPAGQITATIPENMSFGGLLRRPPILLLRAYRLPATLTHKKLVFVVWACKGFLVKNMVFVGGERGYILVKRIFRFSLFFLYIYSVVDLSAVLDNEIHTSIRLSPFVAITHSLTDCSVDTPATVW